jgi:uncharacterized protein
MCNVSFNETFRIERGKMKLPLNKIQAIEWLNSMPQQDESSMNHYLETGAIMKGLAKEFGEDEEYWEILGLLHDVDWAFTKSDWSKHCIKAKEILREKGFDEEFISNVQSHGFSMKEIPELENKKREKKIEFALVSSETLTGIIYAYALMRGRKISDMEIKGLKKKFKDKCFAQNCNRDLVLEIENTGIDLDKFFKIAINSLKEIKEEINLE